MTSHTRISMFLLLLLAETVSTEPQCDANHVKLVMLMDVPRDTYLTMTRIKNVAYYFFSRVEAGLIKTLDVCLLDPFEEKTLFNLTSVMSSDELTAALLNTETRFYNSDDYEDISTYKSNISLTFDHLDKIVSENVKCNIYVVAFLSNRHKEFEENSRFSDLHYKTKSILKIVFVLDMFLYVNNLNNTETESGIVNFDYGEDFALYNPVIWELCRDSIWTKYFSSGQWESSYRIERLNTPISWSEAQKRCDSKRFSLPAIETQDELQFLNEFIKNITIKTDDPSRTLIRNTVVISVSLLKKQELQQNKFMWLNLRPFNLEANLESRENRRERCVAVTFLFKARNQTDEIKWKAVSCDQPISDILVCEKEEERFYEVAEEVYKILDTSPKKQDGSVRSMLDHLQLLNTLKLNASQGMFHCNDDYKQMVFYSFVCDGARDCDNGRDEQYCPTLLPNTKQPDILCTGSTARYADAEISHLIYIPSKARCNMIQDCEGNNIDEQGCDGCLGRQCEDGTCVPSHWLSHDRETCNLFIETNRNWYLNVSYPCTGQCSGMVHFQHEITFCDVNIENASKTQTFHIDETHAEWAPKCLYLRGSDGSITGCQNNRQLRDCKTFQCPEGFLKCPDSYCVPVYNFGDNVKDCPYGEDEIYNFGDRLFQIEKLVKCTKSDIYIHLVHICDGVPQCPYGKDESLCIRTCPLGFFCNGQAVVVANHTLVTDLNSWDNFEKEIKYLNLSGIDLSYVYEPILLPNLLEIDASHCYIETLDLSIFSYYIRYKSLYYVNLSFNKITELRSYGPLSLLNNLQFLNLSNDRHLSKFEKESIRSIFLQTIDLSFTNISVLELSDLEYSQSIRFLNIFQTNIVKIGSLVLIKRLEYFNLQKTLLSQDNITLILKAVSVSTSLYVDNFKYCCPQIAGVGTPQHACHAPPEAFSSCEDLLSDVLKRSLLWMLAGVSVAGNIIVITYRLFYDRDVFKKGYGVFVTNLSISDCVMGVYLLIIASTDIRYRDEYVLHESDWRHSSLCQAAGFLSTLSSETSTFFVFLITLDRYLVIKFPFGNHRLTKLGLVLCVLFVWIIGFFLASVPLMYTEWRIYSTNGMCLGLPLSINQDFGWHYSFGMFICVNFIMFVFITCGQIFIFRSIMSSERFQMTNVQSVARRVQEINIAKQLFLVALSNFLCWFPICVLGFLTLTGHEVSPDTHAWLVIFVMPLNAAINPMIYTIPVMYTKWQTFKEGKTFGTETPLKTRGTLSSIVLTVSTQD